MQISVKIHLLQNKNIITYIDANSNTEKLSKRERKALFGL